jgi:pyruvate dehydrogenase E1 component
MEDRGLKEPTGQKVWAFIGDGESDEPETLGAISLAAREKLDNLIFVINCNLQRLDGPVRGNGKIIQELEAIFRGAGWRVLKLIWGSDWDALLEKDDDDILVTRMNEVVDGEYQKYVVESGAYIREHFFGKNPELLAMAKRLTDEQLRTLRRGGHDSIKIHAAYNHAVNHRGSPTVILAKTIKGYGMGESGEGKNITHQQKKLNEDELREFRTRFGIPIDDDDVAFAPFYLPPKDSKEMQYLRERRAALGGPLPERRVRAKPLATPSALFDEFKEGTGERAVSTTMAMVRVITKLLSDKTVGKYIVPIVPDEARTFGMEALFRQVGIYSHVGQLYEPVDADNLLYYKEAADGQIIEEGITEAGSMSSFIAAGTAYANHGVNTIPFFIYYSMFGMQRIGDLVWLAGDARCKGFLVGGTSGRTTLNGEGLQHQDGHSLVIANTVPSLVVYDPAFAFEIGVIVRDGLRRMYERGEELFYYVTVENENYPQPKMPEGVEEGILKGLYKYRSAGLGNAKSRAHLFGSGAIMNDALRAQEILGTKYGVAADVWSVTSYSQLNREAAACDRWNLLHPEAPRLVPYVTKRFAEESGVIVAASDYMKVLPQSISKWLPLPMTALGTDGYGRSDSRESLREYFEVDARFITLAALTALAEKGEVPPATLTAAIKDLDIDSSKLDPMSV